MNFVSSIPHLRSSGNELLGFVLGKQAHAAQHVSQALALLRRKRANRRSIRTAFQADEIERLFDDDGKSAPRKRMTQRSQVSLSLLCAFEVARLESLVNSDDQRRRDVGCGRDGSFGVAS